MVLNLELHPFSKVSVCCGNFRTYMEIKKSNGYASFLSEEGPSNKSSDLDFLKMSFHLHLKMGVCVHFNDRFENITFGWPGGHKSLESPESKEVCAAH
jgi:hypothetical protein